MKRLQENIRRVDTYDEFKKVLEEHGGFLLAHWCGEGSCEARIKEETKATIRCIPLEGTDEPGRCVRCDGESRRRVYFAQAY